MPGMQSLRRDALIERGAAASAERDIADHRAGAHLESAVDDYRAIEVLARRHRTALMRYFQKRGVSREEAEDAVQEVWTRLAQRQGLAGLHSLEGYLFQTAANIAIDLHRHGRAQRRDQHDSYAEGYHAPADLSPVELIEGHEALAQVVSALTELPERTRRVFVLARLEHMRQTDIAEQVGISVSAVEKHMKRAMVHLLSRVERYA